MPGTTPWAAFKDIYIDAFKHGCKGCTTFRVDGKRMGIFNTAEDDAQADEGNVMGAACEVDPVTGQRSCE